MRQTCYTTLAIMKTFHFFWVCTLKEPYSLVLQFHGAGQESLTLYKAIKEKFFDKVGTVKIFVDICKAVNYIHGKGYLLTQ